ncbi:MAG: hypothetical protein V1930_06295 [Pseudomonadota bacterium]
MLKPRNAFVILVLTAFLMNAGGGFQAFAQDPTQGHEPSGESMIVDFLVLRPLGLVATALGSIVFIASTPFSLLGGNTKAAFKKLVEEPGKFTFARPLGETKDGEMD